MSYASYVKDEASVYEFEYIKDMLSALYKTAGNITLSSGKMALTFKSENAKVAKMVYQHMHDLYNIKPQTSVYRLMKLHKNNYYCISIDEKVNEIIKDLDLMEFNNFKNIIRSDNRIHNYLCGCFLASGSVNDPKTTNYHLELSFVDENYAKLVAKLIEKIGMHPKIIARRNMNIVYLKRAQEIADFIAHIGATNAYLEFENYRMTRDYYNSDNRLVNCDIANSVRTNIAANNQIEQIKIIEQGPGLDSLEGDLLVLAKLRLDNPEDSLRELSSKFNAITKKTYTKSGINHLFIKIKDIANQYVK